MRGMVGEEARKLRRLQSLLSGSVPFQEWLRISEELRSEDYLVRTRALGELSHFMVYLKRFADEELQ